MIGKLPITKALATLLAEALHTTPEFWVNREALYREANLRILSEDSRANYSDKILLYSVADVGRWFRLPYREVVGIAFAIDPGLLISKDVSLKVFTFEHLVEIWLLQPFRYILPAERMIIALVLSQTAREMFPDDLTYTNNGQILLTARFRDEGVAIFVERFAGGYNAGRSDKLVLRLTLDHLLRRLCYGEDGIVERLYPFVPTLPETKGIFIDPQVRDGRPAIAPSNAPVELLTQLYDQGREIRDIADTTQCTEWNVKAAILFGGTWG